MNALRDLGYVGLFVVVMVVCFTVLGHCQAKPERWHYLSPPKQHFWQKHPTRTKLLFAGAGGRFRRRGSCSDHPQLSQDV